MDAESDTQTETGRQKAELRKTLRDRRRRFVTALPPSTRLLSFRVLPSPVLARIPQGAIIALYQAVGDEAPTAGIADQLRMRGHDLLLPRLAPDGVMDFADWISDDALVPGAFGILQPAASAPARAPDIIVAPLLGFDTALNRLGQGGGHYDRAFARHPDAARIGLAWSAQLVNSIPVGVHDQPLEIVVTEAAYYETEGQSSGV